MVDLGALWLTHRKMERNSSRYLAIERACHYASIPAYHLEISFARLSQARSSDTKPFELVLYVADT
jgi:hypothetical protein